MRLFEVIEHSDQRKLIVAVDKLITDLKNGKLEPMTKNQLLDYFIDKYDILSIDEDDLYNFKDPENPLNQLISNIQGDDIVFKGQDDNSTGPNEKSEQEKVVAKMAKSAMK